MHFNEIYIKNNNYRKNLNKCVFNTKVVDVENINNDTFLNKLRHNKKDIFEKQFGDISSFNFKRDVFFSGKWNELSKIARGLFLNNKTGNIIARSYDKFFNYHEANFNSDGFLENNLKFPVTAYHKYNGFLGILSLFNDELLFCSKSTVEGDFANYFKEIFYKENHNIEALKTILKVNNCCLIFEVIDHIHDPHIVKYEEDKLVLLDAVFLKESFENIPYYLLKNIANTCNFFIKQIAYTFNDFNSLFEFMKESEQDMSPQKEGYVLVDENNYHFKLKCKWYKTWKFLRGIKDKIGKKHQFSTSGLTTSLMNNFYGWCKKKEPDYILNTDIITLRDEFLKESENKSNI